MNLDPEVIEAKSRSRVMEWLYFAREQALYEEYRAEEAAFRARGRVN